MLGQLSCLRRRGQRVTQGFFLRGIATQKQGRRHQTAPRSPPPPDPPEKIEWWAVDGELFKAEKFDPSGVLGPVEHDHISNKRRRRELIRHMKKSRLRFKIHDQVPYWAAYMQRFQILRGEWEKHVWDPIPVPQPKRRNPTWLAEETQKYVWADPRREAYVANRNDEQVPSSSYTFDLARMDQSAVRAKFDEKIGYKRQAMSHSPYENRRNPGGSTARPGTMPVRQRNLDFARRKLGSTEVEDFDDVFHNEDTKKGHADAKAMFSTEDEGGSEVELFSWSENDSDEGKSAAGQDDDDDDEDDDSVDDKSKMDDFQPRKKGWFGEEDDLFKDEE